MADEVRIPIRGDSAPLGRELDRSEGLVKRFGGSVKNVFAAVGAITAARRVFGFFSDAVKAAAEQEKSFTRLETIIKTTGNTTGYTAAQLAAMADGLEDTVNIAGEAVMDAQSVLATFKNVRGDVFRDAISRAADLQEVLGTSLKGAVMTLGRALDNPIQGLTSLSRARINFTAEQKKLIEGFVREGKIVEAQNVILKELERRYGGTATAAAGTAAGKVAHFHNVVENASKAIGTALIPMLDVVSPLFEKVGQAVANAAQFFIDTWLPAIQGGADAVWEFLQPALKFIEEAAVTAFAAAKTASENFHDVVVAGLLGFALAAVQTFETVKHWLLTVIPDALAWFGRNWFDTLKTAGDFLNSVFDNMLKNVADFCRAVLAWIRGDGFDFKFTGLTEGFKSSMKELPQIAKREIGETEKELQKQLAEVSGRLGAAQVKNVEEVREKLGGMLGGLFGKSATEALKSNAATVDSDEVKALAKQKAAKTTGLVGMFNKFTRAAIGDERGGQTTRAGAMEGLEELNKRISQAAASKEDKTAAEVRRVVDKQVVLATLQEQGNKLLAEGNALSAKLFSAIPTLGGLL